MNTLSRKSKIVAIVGPTASGKSALAVKIAKKFNGEIISADSRQVYRGMNIGTGKITKKEMCGIPHHLLDVASPVHPPAGGFTAAHYQKLARRAITQIVRRGKLPILCGGTGLYIDAALCDYALPQVKPDWRLRRTLEQKTEGELFTELKRLDPRRAATIDRHNKRRLVRAIEIVRATGKAIPSREEALRRTSQYEILRIGLNPAKDILKKKIGARLAERLRQGMIAEVKKLRARGVSFKRLDGFGLEYRFIARHLQGKIGKEEMVRELEKAIWRYAKRQMTWFKKDRDIVWISAPRIPTTTIERFLK
jgi:tRNA dimethylallyltransferase